MKLTDKDIKQISKLYKQGHHITTICQTFDKSEVAIRVILSKNGIKRKSTIQKTKRREWTNDEIQMLKDLYLNTTYNEICKKLNRSMISVAIKIASLRLIPKIDVIKEKNIKIIENFLKVKNKYTLAEFCLQNNLNQKSIRQLLSINNIKCNTNYVHPNKWTKKEDKKLIKLYNQFTVKEIASKLNRTYYATQSRANKVLKLKKQ